MTADFKAKKLTEIVPETEVAVETKVEYKVYSERWADQPISEIPDTCGFSLTHVAIADGGY